MLCVLFERCLAAKTSVGWGGGMLARHGWRLFRLARLQTVLAVLHCAGARSTANQAAAVTWGDA